MTRTRRAVTIAGVLVLFAATLVGLIVADDARAAGPVPPPAVVAIASDPDQHGARPSTYTGRYYRSVDEPYRRCIVGRETQGANYSATGSGGYYQGAYQMTKALVRGAAWEMTPELRVMFPDRWRLIRDALLDTPGHLWSRFYQDMAFWTVLNVDGIREGAPHWAGGRWSCNPGMS